MNLNNTNNQDNNVSPNPLPDGQNSSGSPLITGLTESQSGVPGNPATGAADPTSASPHLKLTLKQVTWRSLRLAAVGLVLVLMLWALYQNRDELWQALNRAHWGWLSLALALNLAGSLVYVAVWESCARQLQAKGKLAGTLIALSMAGAARYLPGGIWPVAGLVYFAPEIGLPRRQVPVLALLSQLVHLIAAGLAAILSLGLLLWLIPGVGTVTIWLAALVGLVFGLGAIVLLPRYIAPLFPSLSALIRSIKLRRTALYSLLFWLINGLRLWTMVLAFGLSGEAMVLYLVCAGAVTTILSALFFFIPLGLGVVEFSLGWWLAQIMPWHMALAVVALNRLLRTLNDFFYFGVGLVLVRLRRRHQPGKNH